MNVEGLNSRNQYKREVVRIQSLLRSTQMTDENKQEILEKLKKIEDGMEQCKDPTIDQDDYILRKETIDENDGLHEIFKSLWFCVSPMTNEDGELSMAGYVKFHLLLSRCLGAIYDMEDTNAALQAAERDHAHDMEVYGAITREAFYDIVFQVIEMYTEFIDPMYYESFSWAVLDSIADLTGQLPRLKPLRAVQCIMQISNESSMIAHYIDDKAEVAKLTIMNEWMDRVPEVQKRVASRRHGNTLDTTSMETLHAVTRSSRAKNVNNSHEVENTDTEDDISVSSANKTNNVGDANDADDGHGSTGTNESIANIEPEDKLKLELESDSMLNESSITGLDALSDRQLTKRYERMIDKNQSISEESYFSKHSGKKKDKNRWISSTRAQTFPTNDIAPKSNYRRKSVLFATKTLEKVNTYSNKSKTSKNNTNSSITNDSTDTLTAEIQPYNTSSIAEFSVEKLEKSRNTDPYDNDYVEEVDPDWEAFRAQLKLVNEHDRAMQRIAAVEQARRDEEKRKQNEDALVFKLAREKAEEEEAARQLEREAAVADRAQSELDSMLANISLDRQLLNTPGSNVREQHVPLAYIQGNMKDGDEAIDEGSQFDITFGERYELDSFFAASAAASIASEMSSDELVYVAANAARITAEKVKKEAELAAAASGRALKMQVLFEGYEELQILKALKREHEKARLRQEMDTISGSSSKVSIKRLDELQKREMEEKARELEENKAKRDKEKKKMETLSSAISEAEASRHSLSNENKHRKRPVEGNNTTMTDAHSTSEVFAAENQMVLEPHHIDDNTSVVSQITGYMSLPDVDNSVADLDGTFNLTDVQSEASGELFGVSNAGSSIIDDYAGGSYSAVDPKRISQELLRIQAIEKALATKQFPFPHKSFSSIINRAHGTKDGNLGTWNHERAVQMQLLTRAGSMVDEDFEKMHMSLARAGEGALDKLKLLSSKRELPWFANEVHRIRGKNGQTDMEAQRPLIQPGDLRRLSPPRHCEEINTKFASILDEESTMHEASLSLLDVGSCKDTKKLSPVFPAKVMENVGNDNIRASAVSRSLRRSEHGTEVGTPVENMAEYAKAGQANIKQNNTFISKMVIAANVTKKKPKLLLDGMASAFNGYDAKPVFDSKKFSKFVDLPFSMERQSSPVHPNRGSTLINDVVDEDVHINHISTSILPHQKDFIEKQLDKAGPRSPTADAAINKARNEDGFPILPRSPFDENTNLNDHFPSGSSSRRHSSVPASSKPGSGKGEHEALLTNLTFPGVPEYTEDQPSISLRSYHKVAVDKTRKKSLILCSEKTMSAIKPAQADPVGPASFLGTESIEDHPRFRYSGLPAPLMPPPNRYLSNAANMLEMKEKIGIEYEPNADMPKKEKGLNGSQAPFWLPPAIKCMNDPMHHDRSSHINGWNELKDELARRNPNADSERGNVLLTIKRQEAYLLRFNDYVSTTKARGSNAEFVRFVNKDTPPSTEGNAKALYGFYDKYESPLLKERVKKLQVERQKAAMRKEDFESRRAAMEAALYAN